MKMLTNSKSHYSNPLQRYRCSIQKAACAESTDLTFMTFKKIFISWHNPFKGSVTLCNKVFWLFSPTWRRDKRWVKLRYYLKYLKHTVLRKEEEKQDPRFFCCRLTWVPFPCFPIAGTGKLQRWHAREQTLRESKDNEPHWPWAQGAAPPPPSAVKAGINNKIPPSSPLG